MPYNAWEDGVKTSLEDIVSQFGSVDSPVESNDTLLPSYGVALPLMAQATSIEQPRNAYYTSKGGKIYAGGVEIGRLEAISTVERAKNAIKKNEQQLIGAPRDLLPLLQQANALARNKLEQDIRELNGILGVKP